MTTEEALERLAFYINKGNCALFIGPDIGESAGGFRGVPTAWRLADELARHCGYRGRYRTIADLAGPCERILGDRRQLIQFLRQRIDLPELRPLPVHRLIATLPFPIIVSGGWDTLLETALRDQNVAFRSIQRNTDLPYIDPSSQDVLLYKPYGSFADPGSLVISENDQLEVFYNLGQVVRRLEGIIEQYCLLLVGYALAQDSVFVRIYHDILRAQGHNRPPAFAVQSLDRPDTAVDWEAHEVFPIITEPMTFLRDLSEAVASLRGQDLHLPDLIHLSDAPRLTDEELKEQAELLDEAMHRIGVSDLVEQTSVPLLSEEQLQDIEAMRAAYERLAQSFAIEDTSPHVWLLQGNIEYVRQNYGPAAKYYERALIAEPDMAEAYHNLHYVRLARRDWAGAMQAYQRAVALKPYLAILPQRYRIESVLGSGGLGAVYEAWDTQDNQPVAIKVLHRQYAQTEQVLIQFKREATILQGLDHSNIVRLQNFIGYRGSYFLVMEFLEGQTLKERLEARSGPMALDEAFDITSQLCTGLAYAHSCGIVHRDIKPSNIFLTPDGVKLIDFGLARPLTPGQLSTQSMPSGTIAYMAPEQVEGKVGDQRTDVYAVATVFYEMITGRNPGLGAYRPPSELVAGLNEALDLTIETARERKPEDRHPTVTVFKTELKQVVAMQAATVDAPLIWKIISRVVYGIDNVTERLWPWLLAIAAFLGFIVPLLSRNSIINEGARITSFLVIVSLISSVLAGWATVSAGRRGRSAVVAAYGHVIGVILGVLNGVIWLKAMIFIDYPTPECYAAMGQIDGQVFLMVTLIFLAGCLVFLLFELIVLLGVGALARHLIHNYAAGFFLTFLMEVVGLIAFAMLAECSWFSSVIVPT